MSVSPSFSASTRLSLVDRGIYIWVTCHIRGGWKDLGDAMAWKEGKKLN